MYTDNSRRSGRWQRVRSWRGGIRYSIVILALLVQRCRYWHRKRNNILYTYIFTCIYVCTHACMYVCIYACMCSHTHICLSIHVTYIHIFRVSAQYILLALLRNEQILTQAASGLRDGLGGGGPAFVGGMPALQVRSAIHGPFIDPWQSP